MATRGHGRGTRGNGKEHNGFDNPTMASSVRVHRKEWEIEVQKKISEFQTSSNQQLAFPPMDKTQRKRIHELANRFGLLSNSEGKDPSRNVVLQKKRKPIISLTALTVETSPIYLTKPMHDKIRELVLNQNIREYDVKLHHSINTTKRIHKNRSHHQSHNLHEPKIVPPMPNSRNEFVQKLTYQRLYLPAYKMKDDLLAAINKNKVVLITGGTGCGKTTQVPQFILDDATAQGKPIRIICTQPRRLPAITVAERVAKERGEKVGETVGYHIRLEKKESCRTVLTYCTSGVLLRMLTQDEAVKNYSHIILDEIHEREQNTDYLLIALKQAIVKQTDLKIVLMSATMEGNLDLFKKYFDKVSVQHINIPSQLYKVEKLFLGDILALTGFKPPESVFNSGSFGSRPDGLTDTQDFPSVSTWSKEGNEELQLAQMQIQTNATFNIADPSQFAVPPPNNGNWNMIPAPHYAPHYQPMNNGMPHASTWSGGMDQYSEQYAIEHPTTTQDYETYQQTFPHIDLTQYDPRVPPPRAWTCTDYQQNFSNQTFHNSCETVYRTTEQNTYIPSFQQQTAQNTSADGFGVAYQRSIDERRNMRNMFDQFQINIGSHFTPDGYRRLRQLIPSTQYLADAYFKLGGEQYLENVDADLITCLTRHLMDSTIPGAILIFLPGYDDISDIKEKIELDYRSHNTTYEPYIFTLHSQMNTNDQHKIFERVPNGYRKVILSTNIAEASLTIDDVVFVIDSGKVKEKSYDHDSRISQLKTGWIAKSNSEQRAGRAGRCQEGYCFRLYSETDYNKMAATQKAEMQRAAIHEVCLHAKIFAPENMSVRDFLSMAPEPPSLAAIDNSMAFLEQLGALYSQESTKDIDETGHQSYIQPHHEPEMTDLGLIIAKLPLDPQLARMLLFGLVFKTLTPIATLVAALSHRDPFIIPSPEDREKCNKARDRFAAMDFSDHLALLRAINEFEDKNYNQQNDYCRRNFLSLPAMRMIIGIRKQLLKELSRVHLIQDVHSALCDDEYNKYSGSWPMVQLAIAAGCYPGIGFTKPASKLRKIRTGSEMMAGLHPSSVIKRQILTSNKRDSAFNAPLEYLAYQELAQLDEGLTLKTVTIVPPVATVLAVGPLRLKLSTIRDFSIVCENEALEVEKEQDELAGIGEEPKLEFGTIPSLPVLVIEDWLAAKGTIQSMRDVLRLRFKLMSYFLEIISCPYLLHERKQDHEEILATVNFVLIEDHKRQGFSDVPATDYYNKQRFTAQRNAEFSPEFGQNVNSNRDQRFAFPSKPSDPYFYANLTYQHYQQAQQYGSNDGQSGHSQTGYYQNGSDYRNDHSYSSNNQYNGSQKNEDFRNSDYRSDTAYHQEHYQGHYGQNERNESHRDNGSYNNFNRTTKEDKSYDNYEKRDDFRLDYPRGSNGNQKGSYRRGNYSNYQSNTRRPNYNNQRSDRGYDYQAERDLSPSPIVYPADVDRREMSRNEPSPPLKDQMHSQDVRVQQGRIPHPIVTAKATGRAEQNDRSNRDYYKRDSIRNKREQLDKKKESFIDSSRRDNERRVNDFARQSTTENSRNGHSGQKVQQNDVKKYEKSIDYRSNDYSMPSSSQINSSQFDKNSQSSEISSIEAKLVKLSTIEDIPPPDPVIKNEKNSYRGNRYTNRKYYKPKQRSELDGVPYDYAEASKEQEKREKKTFYNKTRNPGLVFENSGLKNKNSNRH